MTPKEKAQELVQKYYNRFEHTISDEYAEVEYEVCKQCALIALDEILNLSKIASLRRDEVYMELEYWQEIKQEIDNL